MHDASLIGRAHGLDVLRGQVARTRASHGGLLFVTGEPGIGKTALVRHAAQEAVGQGLRVLYGSCCDAGATPGYGPWTQVVRGLRRSSTAAERERATAASDQVLAVLSGKGDAAEGLDRFELYDLVTGLLSDASRSRPVLVVLDDLHWADPGSLDLLEFLTQHAWFERLLVLGTYRDAEAQRPGHPLREPDRALPAKATTLRLTGLSVAEVAELIGRTAGRPPDPGLAEEVHRRTGGNPFFVAETARLWSAGQPLTALSPGVRAVVHRRLTLLTEPAADLLAAAAVLGRRLCRTVLTPRVSRGRGPTGCSPRPWTPIWHAARARRPGDRDRAAGLLREAASEARRLGMAHLAERAGRGFPTDAPPPRLPDNGNEFTRTGAVWRLRHAGRAVHVPDAKGLRDLHCLLGRPGTPVPAVRLLDPDGGDLVPAAHALGADPVLDDEAKQRYRLRLERLDEEIDRAAASGDENRAAEYEQERAALLDELRRAAGLAGRSRRLGDAGERARKNVTARIRDSLRRLDALHPELAAHLRAAVTTGTSCCYTPDRETTWRL